MCPRTCNRHHNIVSVTVIVTVTATYTAASIAVTVPVTVTYPQLLSIWPQTLMENFGDIIW